jgi:hypothetical protein
MDSENSSKNKRKFTEVIEKSKYEMNNSKNLEDEIEKIYSEFFSNCLSWTEKFSSIMLSEISENAETYFPRTLSSAASKLLSSQKFWILWIEHLRPRVTVNILIPLFNESFNYINEESLMKAYFLKTMREADEVAIKELLLSKGKILDLSLPFMTNQILFGLLESFAQFLLRSNSKNQNISEEKKIKSSNSRKDASGSDFKYKCDSNFEMTINPVMMRKEFNNTQISSSENIFYVQQKENEMINEFSGNKLNKMLVSPLFVKESPVSFKTPENSKRESMNVLGNENQPFRVSGSNFREEESDEVVHDLTNNCQKNKDMIISQNTIDKQLEFNCKLQNANSYDALLYSQDVIPEEQIKCHLIPLEGMIELELAEETAEISQLPDDKTVETDDIKKNIEDENLEVILELEAEKNADENYIPENSPERKENNLNLSRVNNFNNVNSLNNNVSFTQSSKSRSRSRSRGRNFHSYVTEEYPSDLVEGSIRTFSKHFLEGSAESKSNLTSRKEEN